MTGNGLPVSEHYLGAKGKDYFESSFNSQYEFGRVFQTRYFRPYVTNESIILDFGCADGLFLRSLPARERIGVEINPAAREKCIEFCEKTSIPIELHETLADIESDRADVVISNHSLEHVPCPYATLKEIKRILKPMGLLILLVPFDDWRLKGHRRWKPGDTDNHLYTWSPLNLGNLLIEAGFQVNESRLCTTAWSPKIFWVYSSLGERCFRMACYLLSRLKNSRELFCMATKGDQ